ncbi:hypothetical protein SAMN04487866_1128 [Thermoactinomyces sp. DSM 45891]|nr:hypothetical protein SAMN04487866_1128 [Thermoactinomyces sp. DSM 45891]
MLHILNVEFKRAILRWQTWIAFVLFVGCIIVGVEIFRPGELVPFDPNTHNPFNAFLYAIGNGARPILLSHGLLIQNLIEILLSLRINLIFSQSQPIPLPIFSTPTTPSRSIEPLI